MCEANVYLRKSEDDEYELFLESVDKIFPGEEEIVMENIFGHREVVRAKIKEMALVDHKIMLERI